MLLPYQKQRADQLHARPVVAFHLGHHGFELAAVEQAHQRRGHRVVIVMAQSDLVAAALLRLLVQIAAAHGRAHMAGRSGHVVYDGKDIAFKYLDGEAQPARVLLHLGAVFRRIAGIHRQVAKLKGHLAVALQRAQTGRQQQRILAA